MNKENLSRKMYKWIAFGLTHKHGRPLNCIKEEALRAHNANADEPSLFYIDFYVLLTRRRFLWDGSTGETCWLSKALFVGKRAQLLPLYAYIELNMPTSGTIG